MFSLTAAWTASYLVLGMLERWTRRESTASKKVSWKRNGMLMTDWALQKYWQVENNTTIGQSYIWRRFPSVAMLQEAKVC